MGGNRRPERLRKGGRGVTDAARQAHPRTCAPKGAGAAEVASCVLIVAQDDERRAATVRPGHRAIGLRLADVPELERGEPRPDLMDTYRGSQ